MLKRAGVSDKDINRFKNSMDESRSNVEKDPDYYWKVRDNILENNKPKEGQKVKADQKQEYFNKRNSFKTDEDKDLWEQQQKASSKAEKDKIINDRVKLAKQTNQYEMEFLERGLDVDDYTGEQLKGKALDDAYRKYLQEEKNYYK